MAQKERKYPRAKPIIEIKVLSLNGVIIMGRLLDVSEGGAKIGIDMAPHYAIGNEINIAFMLSDPESARRNPIFARGIVAWLKADPNSSEVGLKFEEILPSHQKRIREFVNLLH